MSHPANDETDRSILTTRTIDAPRRYVFEAWTEVRHLAEWFGPDGFTTTTAAFDFRPGGIWTFVLHGPDGTDFPNWVEWLEIEPPERLVFRQGARANDQNAFLSRVTFEAHGQATIITLHSLFNTKAQRDEVVERFGALEGARQTLRRLDEYLATQPITRATSRTDIEDRS